MKYFYSFITFIFLVYIILLPGIKDSVVLEILNIAIALICSIGVFSYEKAPFSLFKVFNVFFIFFFCVAPTLQFKNDIHFLGTLFMESDYILTTSVSLLVLVIFDSVYILTFSQKHKLLMTYTSKITLTQKTVFQMTAISAVVCVIMLWMNNFNLASLFVRGGDLKTSVEVSSISSLILSNFLRPMPMIVFIAALVFGLRNKFILFFLFICLIFACPPTGVERFTVAAIYLPVLLQLFPILWKKNVFVLALVFGLLVVFPFLNNFRYFDSNTDFKLSLNFDQFLELHFDSFSMFMRVLKDNIVTYGRQLLGVLLFWVPRSFWPNKPVGSGHFVSETTNLGFGNISMPFFAEGYINFGLLGIILFTVLLALFASKQDRLFWSNASFNCSSWNKIRYYIFIGMFLFVLRGDLMSSFAFLCGYIAAFYAVKHILQERS